MWPGGSGHETAGGGLGKEQGGGLGAGMAPSALTGTRIRERRTLLGLKQAELARAVGVSPSYLNLIEHNRRRIAGKLLAEIATELQVDVAALTRGAQAELLEQLSQAVAGGARGGRGG